MVSGKSVLDDSISNIFQLLQASHKRRKDILETRAALIEIYLVS